jgi:hypothetical protein
MERIVGLAHLSSGRRRTPAKVRRGGGAQQVLPSFATERS